MAAGVAGARIAEVPVRHHPRRYGISKYGLSRVGKVLADLAIVAMIRWFRERPLAMFARGALVAVGLSASFAAAAVVSLTTFGPAKANAMVLPGAAMLWVALATYLMLLGLIAEVAVGHARDSLEEHLPLMHEETHQ